MKINNNLYSSSLNSCKNLSNGVEAKENLNTENSGKYASVPVSVLKAYNVNFGHNVKEEEFIPNAVTNELEYCIMPPQAPGIEEAVVYGKDSQEIARSDKRDKDGRFVISLPVLDYKTNEFVKKLEIDGISYLSPENEETAYDLKELVIDPEKLMKTCCADKKVKINGKTLKADFDVISEGDVEGKFVIKSAQEVIDYDGKEPLVVLLKSPKDFARISNYVYDEFMTLSPAIKGLVGDTTNYENDRKESLKTFSHAASRLRNHVAIAYVPQSLLEEINKSINAEDEPFVNFVAVPGSLELKQIAKLSPIDRTPVKPPVNKMADRVLLPEDDDFSQEAVGLKAYNLGVLKKNEEVGGYHVPEFFAIPAGVLAKIPQPEDMAAKIKEIDSEKNPEEKLADLRRSIISTQIPEEIMSEILDANPELLKRNLGSDMTSCLIARSSFNGEDSDKMSTQGLYDSFPGIRNEGMLKRDIKQVMASKWSNLAYTSRRNHKISHDAIQPNVIIQEVVPVDYTFTLYTADARTNDPSKMVIDMSQGVSSAVPGAPYIFEYDKKSLTSKRTSLAKKANMMRIEDIPNPALSALRMQDCDYSKDPFNRSHKEYAPIMDKIFEVAQFIEDISGGRPQDIEGGIILKRDEDGKVVDADVYIWQTRDAHIKKRK